MKLELKHIAPYLPYGLKLIHNQIGDSELSKMTISNLETVVDMVNRNVENKAMFPILRPLSDLTKEIEVNGEKFVPIERILRTYRKEFGFDYCTINDFEIWALDADAKPTDETMTLNDYLKLFKYHFDVFGLIEQCLAIDINTIENR